jgi:hypothetical protein
MNACENPPLQPCLLSHSKSFLFCLNVRRIILIQLRHISDSQSPVRSEPKSKEENKFSLQSFSWLVIIVNNTFSPSPWHQFSLDREFLEFFASFSSKSRPPLCKSLQLICRCFCFRLVFRWNQKVAERNHKKPSILLLDRPDLLFIRFFSMTAQIDCGDLMKVKFSEWSAAGNLNKWLQNKCRCNEERKEKISGVDWKGRTAGFVIKLNSEENYRQKQNSNIP